MSIRRVLSLVLLLILVIALALPAYAQTIPFAAVTQNQLMLYGLSENPVPVGSPGQYTDYQGLTWSPDGQILAFGGVDQDYNTHLLITDCAGSPPIELATDLALQFPLSFTADGQILYAVSTGEMVQDEQNPVGGERLNVNTIAPAAGAAPVFMGSFVLGMGCGGGGNLPMMIQYWAEVGTGPGSGPMVLASTPYGIVHTINCTGSGLALLNSATGVDTVIDPALGWASIAPDGGQLVGLHKRYSPEGVIVGELVLGNLSNLVTAVTPTLANPDLVVWGRSPDGTSVFYSSYVTSRSIPPDPVQQQQLSDVMGGINPVTFDVNTVEIHRVNIVTGEDVPLYQGEGYAVARMQPTPDGNALLFSMVASIEPWVNAVLVSPTDPWDIESAYHFVTIDLYYLNLADGATSLLGLDLQKAALNAAAYAP